MLTKLLDSLTENLPAPVAVLIDNLRNAKVFRQAVLIGAGLGASIEWALQEGLIPQDTHLVVAGVDVDVNTAAQLLVGLGVVFAVRSTVTPVYDPDPAIVMPPPLLAPQLDDDGSLVASGKPPEAAGAPVAPPPEATPTEPPEAA